VNLLFLLFLFSLLFNCADVKLSDKCAVCMCIQSRATVLQCRAFGFMHPVKQLERRRTVTCFSVRVICVSVSVMLSLGLGLGLEPCGLVDNVIPANS